MAAPGATEMTRGLIATAAVQPEIRSYQLELGGNTTVLGSVEPGAGGDHNTAPLSGGAGGVSEYVQ
jgi:hypothetical protein